MKASFTMPANSIKATFSIQKVVPADDYALSDDLTTEITNRENADSTLQESIDTINTTISTYGDIVTHDVSEFATSEQGVLADSALQSGDNISELTNDSGYLTGISSSDITTALGYTPYDASNPDGYTSNTGTVTSVNDVYPVSGNVTLKYSPVSQTLPELQQSN